MIVCMILNHCAKYFWLNGEENIYIQVLLWLDYFIAANFLLISGFAYNYYAHFRKNDPIKKTSFLAETVLRAVSIYGIATLMSVLFGKLGGLDDSWSHWSIFKIIGLGMIIILILDSLPNTEFLLAAVMGAFFSLGYLSTIVDNNVLDFFSKGTFAFFPWFYFFGSGYLMGRKFNKYDESGLEISSVKKMLLPALILVVLCVTPVVQYNLNAYVEWNLRLFLGNVGLFVWYLAVFYYILRKTIQQKVKWVLDQITEYGKISFSLYYLHFALIYFVMLINRHMYGGDLFVFMDAWRFTAIVLALLIVLNTWCVVWRKYNYIMGIEWAIGKMVYSVIRK